MYWEILTACYCVLNGPVFYKLKTVNGVCINTFLSDWIDISMWVPIEGAWLINIQKYWKRIIILANTDIVQRYYKQISSPHYIYFFLCGHLGQKFVVDKSLFLLNKLPNASQSFSMATCYKGYPQLGVQQYNLSMLFLFTSCTPTTWIGSITRWMFV